MRKLSMGMAVMAAFAFAGTAWGQAINKVCPVKGTPAKAGIIAEYEGKVIGFC